MVRKVGTSALAFGLLGGALGAFGCFGNPDGMTDENGQCLSTREFFTTEVYGKALQACTGCHTAGGDAVQRGAKFVIYRDTYPDFVSANIAAMADYAKLEVEGKPVILRKPLGERQHGGGKVLAENSEEYKTLSKFIEQLRAGEEVTCGESEALAVSLMSSRETVRKAALLLAGRYPTEVELQQGEVEATLPAVLTQLTREEAFYDFLRETWNDVMLTERGLDAGAAGVYNNAPDFYNDSYPGYTQEKRRWAGVSLTQEPLRYIEYVVRNDLPFSDVVAGNYIVANPYVARSYGLPHEKDAVPENILEWQRIDYSPAQNQIDGRGDEQTRKTIGVPVAGVLTTPAFLSRWETTQTNRGRKRARVVLKTFLATDIFKFAQRPVDSTALTSVQNPTSNSGQCTVCHTVIDPIAGAFRGFAENDNMARFNSGDKWHDDMFPPGINGELMPPQNYGNAIMWLGAQIPRDPRFAISIAQVMYKGLIGQDPLVFPQDKAAADYTDRVRAYNAQNDWFVQVAAKFSKSNFDMRALVVEIIMSPYFRAKSSEPGRDALHDGLGPGRLLTPEQLGRKYAATTGLYYFRYDGYGLNPLRVKDGYRRSDLVDDREWRLVYGGIDSGDVTKRADTLSPIMLATAQYTGSVVACRATSYDFTKPTDQRRLFPKVELNTVPFSPRANADLQLIAVPDAEEKIRANLVHLYFRLLGEVVTPESLQVTEAYNLFVDVWKDLEDTDLKSGGEKKGMFNGACNATVDWDKGVTFQPNENGDMRAVYTDLAEVPEGGAYQAGMRLTRDANYTVRAWQAVMTYLLTDYRFTHE